MMHWNSFADFLAMGGYAGYVWGSLGVTAAALLLEPFFIARRRRAVLTQLRRQWRAEQADAAAGRTSGDAA